MQPQFVLTGRVKNPIVPFSRVFSMQPLFSLGITEKREELHFTVFFACRWISLRKTSIDQLNIAFSRDFGLSLYFIHLKNEKFPYFWP